MHVVALSGGKDSTAMALRLRELNPDTEYVYVCTPTGDELPEMFEHWKLIGDRLGSRLIPIMGGTLDGKIAEQNALPNWRQRWCTRMLKIEPYRSWLVQQAEQHEKIVSYVGLRADEQGRAGGAYSDIPGVEMRFPMREWGWGLGDVWSYLAEQRITIPERTDCARCFFQTLGQWWVLWHEHPDIYADAERQESETGHTFRSPGRDTWPAGLADLRNRFEAGHVPPRTQMHADLFGQNQCRVCSM